MTKDEINKRVAELMGWKKLTLNVWFKSTGESRVGLPDFCGDPLLWGPPFVADLEWAVHVDDSNGAPVWIVYVRSNFRGQHAELVPAYWLARIAREEARRGCRVNQL